MSNVIPKLKEGKKKKNQARRDLATLHASGDARQNRLPGCLAEGPKAVGLVYIQLGLWDIEVI